MVPHLAWIRNTLAERCAPDFGVVGAGGRYTDRRDEQPRAGVLVHDQFHSERDTRGLQTVRARADDAYALHLSL